MRLKVFLSGFWFCLFQVVIAVTVFAQTESSTEAIAPATAEQPTPVPTSLSSLAVNPASEIIRIKERQQQLQEIIKTQEAATAEAATAVVEALRKRIDALNNRFLTHSQQISAYENWMTLQNELKQIQADHQNLKAATDTPEISFLDLNNLREQVNAESSREQNIHSKIELAGRSLQQAKDQYQQRQTQLSDLKVKLDNTQDESEQSVLQHEWLAANAAVESASERILLRQIELTGEHLNKEVFQARLGYLQERLEKAQSNVVFTQKQLDEQLLRIEKQNKDIQRSILQLVNQEANVELRLASIRNKVAQTEEPTDGMLQERRARELEKAGLEEQKNALNEQLQWIPVHKEVWDKRFDVFNDRVEKSVLLEWKGQAGTQIENLNQEERDISLDLETRSNQLITLRNTIANLGSDNPESKRWLEAQEAHLQTIINTLREQQTFIEVTRRLVTKLINEIDQILAVQTWGDFFGTFLKKELYSNSYRDWGYAFGISVCLFVLFVIVRWVLLNRVRALNKIKHTPVLEGLQDVIARTRPTFFFVFSLFIGSNYLQFSEENRTFLFRLMMIALIIQGAIMASYFMQTFIRHFFEKRARQDQASSSARSIFNFISQLVVWSLALILAIDNLGYDPTALITGLGIGGIAVALALQNILSDLFASLSIVMDKPFKIGDFIIIDSYMGSVEHIGIKTTRLRSLSGEQIICSNGDLLNSRIRNFKRMYERRVAFTVGVTYQTTHQQLQSIPPMIKDIIEHIEFTRFDRCHFSAFGDFSLNFETVYYVLSSDYTVYMDIQQKINLAMFKHFEDNQIEFAYPTQTVFLEKPGGNADIHPR